MQAVQQDEVPDHRRGHGRNGVACKRSSRRRRSCLGIQASTACAGSAGSKGIAAAALSGDLAQAAVHPRMEDGADEPHRRQEMAKTSWVPKSLLSN